MEVYVDDMLVKSPKEEKHLDCVLLEFVKKIHWVHDFT